MRTRISFLRLFIISIFSSLLFITSCGIKSQEGLVLITVSDKNHAEPDYFTGEYWRYIPGSRLLLIDPDEPGKEPELLTDEFFSACSPEVSFDGKSIAFTGQKNENDSWQIWELTLKNKRFRQVTSGKENSIDPVYLPGDRLLFSRFIKNDSLKGEYNLFTCNSDGRNLNRITFNPHTYFASSILNDGRVITISSQLYPLKEKSSMMILRPDGTKSELFYQGAGGSTIFSRGRETENGNIVFIETSDSLKSGSSLISINYNRPLHSRSNLTSSSTGDFCSVAPYRPGRLLVSFRPKKTQRFALYSFDSEKKSLENPIYSFDGYDVLEAINIKEHEKPKKLPSEVDAGVKTGQLLCQNINISGMTSPETTFPFMQADRIEIMGLDSSLGVIEVEKDGSFYLKVAADMPFRIKSIDNKGKVINGPGGWIWLRPNERRGCTGCHEDQEMVPANRLSLAVKKNPVSVPVHVTGIKEKIVELE